MKIENPAKTWTGWIAPGGGIASGEDPETALRRELYEELGLRDFELGPHVWNRKATFLWDTHEVEQSERFYLVRTARFEITGLNRPEAEEVRVFRGFRWWPVDAIARSDESFAPRMLARHSRALLADGVPASPIDVGT